MLLLGPSAERDHSHQEGHQGRRGAGHQQHQGGDLPICRGERQAGRLGRPNKGWIHGSAALTNRIRANPQEWREGSRMEHTAGQIHHPATDSGSVELCMFSPPHPTHPTPCLCGFSPGFPSLEVTHIQLLREFNQSMWDQEGELQHLPDPDQELKMAHRTEQRSVGPNRHADTWLSSVGSLRIGPHVSTSVFWADEVCVCGLQSFPHRSTTFSFPTSAVAGKVQTCDSHQSPLDWGKKKKILFFEALCSFSEAGMQSSCFV